MPPVYGMFKCLFNLFSIFEITSAWKMATLTQIVVQVKVHLFDLPRTCAVYFDSVGAQFLLLLLAHLHIQLQDRPLIWSL